jgi:hypothetical protein
MSTGSSERNLRIDWEENGVTPWTKHVAVIFEARFLQEHRMGSFPLLQNNIEPGAVANAFLKVVHALKDMYGRVYSNGYSRKQSNPDVSRRHRHRSRRNQVPFNVHSTSPCRFREREDADVFYTAFCLSEEKTEKHSGIRRCSWITGNVRG